MSLKVQCPECQKSYKIASKLQGKRVKCKCGGVITVPAAEVAAVDELELAPLETPLTSDPLGDLGAPVPTASTTLKPLARPEPEPEKEKRKKKGRKAKADDSERKLMLIGVAVGGVSLIVAIVAIFMLISMNRAGATSPEDAYADYQFYVKKREWQKQFSTIAPSSQEEVLSSLVSLATHMVADKPNTSTEIQELFSQYGSEEGSPDDWWTGVKKKDVFYNELIKAISQSEENTWPINGTIRTMMRKSIWDARKRRASAKLVDLKVDGDVARGQTLLIIDGDEFKEPIEFERVNSRWFVRSDEIPQFQPPLSVGGGMF